MGCFKYENVSGARTNLMEDHIPDDVIEDRFNRFMIKAQELSESTLQEKVGKTYTCVIDTVEPEKLICRTVFDAPEIDGLVYVPRKQTNHCVGDRVLVKIKASSEYDLEGDLT